PGHLRYGAAPGLSGDWCGPVGGAAARRPAGREGPLVTPSPALAEAAQSPTPEERLERGDVLFYPTCPFRLPEGDDRRFLLEQELAGRAHKNISYNPHNGKAGGYRATSAARAERLRGVL